MDMDSNETGNIVLFWKMNELTIQEDFIKIGVIFVFFGLFGYAYIMKRNAAETTEETVQAANEKNSQKG